ncbi:MAG: N-acetylneuraminate synthase family protein [bacterium]|nr:N-acetylneuraminate synthase family protein [bacterium]
MNSEKIWEKIQKGVFIIAEVGKNFIQTEEDQPVGVYLENAKRLVDEAVAAGADAVKIQTHSVEDEILNINFVSPHFPNWKSGDRYGWVTRNTKGTPVKEFLLPLMQYAKEKGIFLFSTPMSRGAAKILHEQVNTQLWKIGSGDILDFVMLDYLRNTDKPIMLSSGMSTLEEVEKAVNFLREKNPRVALLHCVSKYPCPPEDLSLRTMDLYRRKFDMPIGFSDHSIGIEPDILAVAMGATILEKHFSVSRDVWGPDHKVSMTPAELRDLVRGVRELENNPAKKKEILESDYGRRGMGAEEKVLQDGETVFRPLFRKALMASQDIPPGIEITKEMLYAMRPQAMAGGLPSEKYKEVLGKKTKIALKKFDPITIEVLM